jgi:hypothetical protein
MKNIHEMTENEIMENFARIMELTPILEEKKNKIKEDDNKRLEQFAYNKLALMFRNINNKNFNIIDFTNEIIVEYRKILSEINVYTEEELDLCTFIMEMSLFSQINK